MLFRNASICRTHRIYFYNSKLLHINESRILHKISTHKICKAIRIKQPFGIIFVLGPASWALAIGAPPGCYPDPIILLKFITGAFLVRSSACIINDFLDRKFDAKVERTKNRVLVTGEMSSKYAIILIIVMMLGAFGVLLSLGSSKCTALGILCVPVIISYPLFKRFTYWPHLMLGLTTSMGIIIGWTISRDTFDYLVVIPLITASVGWIMFHDIVYAFQDLPWDKKANVKSAAVFISRFGKEKHLLSFVAALSVFGWIFTGYNSEQTWPFYLSLSILAAYYSFIIRKFDPNNLESVSKLFLTNVFVPPFMFSGLVASNLRKKLI